MSFYNGQNEQKRQNEQNTQNEQNPQKRQNEQIAQNEQNEQNEQNPQKRQNAQNEQNEQHSQACKYGQYKDIDTKFHPVNWSEPVIYDLGRRGIRNDIVPDVDDRIAKTVGDVMELLPEGVRRKEPAKLPELSEPEIVRHYIRLSQNTLGYDCGNSIGLGTCTMKYSPKINDQLSALPSIYELHPLQDERMQQGCLQIYYELRDMLCAIAGMDEFTFLPRGGGHGVFTNACMIKAYHKARGENFRDEIVTTAVSHPVNAGAPASLGLKVITLYPDPETGDIGIEQMKAAISRRTAGLMITAPYDTGVFDSRIKDYVDMIHEAGGLVSMDQANFNGVIGRLRAGDIGADMMHFNLHKTFSTPHGSSGPGAGAVGVKKHIAPFLPTPVITFDGSNYHREDDRPQSIGKVGSFYGNFGVVLRTYAWIKSMGAMGLLEASAVSVLNNNYLIKRMLGIRGVDIAWPNRKKLQEARFTVEQLFQDTGVTTDEVNQRLTDFGVVSYFSSHEPMIVPNPITPEAPESVTVEDLDRFADIIGTISKEAYVNPEIVRTAPHRAPSHKIKTDQLYDFKTLATTWRRYLELHPDHERQIGI